MTKYTHDQLNKIALSRPGVKKEYDSLKEEFDYLIAKARNETKKAGLCKSDIQKTIKKVRKEN